MSTQGTTARNWFEIYLLILSVGFAATWGTTNSGEVTSVFPAWARAVWFGGLAIGSAVAVVGELIFTNAALMAERAALYFLTSLISAYMLAFVLVGVRTASWGHVIYVAVALMSFALVNFGRAQQIGTQVRSIYHVYTALTGERHD